MLIKKCAPYDVPLLAAMNKRLIEDEKSDNPMSAAELEERMSGFLGGGYDAFFFVEEGTIVGYALVRRDTDPLYLRQFYIERQYRRMHYGENAFRKLMGFLDTDTIDIDVLPHNEAGRLFWKKCGFTETCVSMRYKSDET